MGSWCAEIYEVPRQDNSTRLFVHTCSHTVMLKATWLHLPISHAGKLATVLRDELLPPTVLQVGEEWGPCGAVPREEEGGREGGATWVGTQELGRGREGGEGGATWGGPQALVQLVLCVLCGHE